MTTINIFTGDKPRPNKPKVVRPGRVAKKPSPVRPVALPPRATNQVQPIAVAPRPTNVVRPVTNRTQVATRTAFPVASRSQVATRTVFPVASRPQVAASQPRPTTPIKQTVLPTKKYVKPKVTAKKVGKTILKSATPWGAAKMGLKIAGKIGKKLKIGKKFKKLKKRW